MDGTSVTDNNTKLVSSISSSPPSSSPAEINNSSSMEAPKEIISSSSSNDLNEPRTTSKPFELNDTLATSTTTITSTEAVTPATTTTAAIAPSISATPLTEQVRPIMLSRSGTSEALKPVSSNNMRSASPSSSYSRSNSTDSIRHPDLSGEVAALSAKLIQAANVQSSLDDTLQTTRSDLEVAKRRIEQLEGAANSHVDMIERGLLIRKQDVEEMETRFGKELIEERKRRAQVEKEKKAIELELENLTSALFEEANTMVIAARQDREATERKNEQLKNQLNETQILLASQQEQLQDLKLVMQQISSDRDENETNPTAPSTPAISSPHDRTTRYLDAALLSPAAAGPEETPPDHPLHFSHLLRPVMRTDLQFYDDFKSLLKISSPTSPSSRAGSGNYSNLALNMKAFASAPHLATTSSTDKPSQQPSQQQQQSQSTRPSPTTTSLKETKFYKRTAVEDIEPTLRLDIAPGLSWLARRSVLACVASSSLIIEPFTAPSRFHGPVYPCTLCGESRRKDVYARRYRFRTSDAEEAQRYPLCDYCLGRVRACCDYTGFLRMVRDGLWRAESDEEAKVAWDECVKLRERMFWTRLGGGVVPTVVVGTKDVSPKSAFFRRSSNVEDGNNASSSDEADETFGDAKTVIDPLTKVDDDGDAGVYEDNGSIRTVRIDSAHEHGDGGVKDNIIEAGKNATEDRDGVLSPTDSVGSKHMVKQTEPSTPTSDEGAQQSKGNLSLNINQNDVDGSAVEMQMAVNSIADEHNNSASATDLENPTASLPEVTINGDDSEMHPRPLDSSKSNSNGDIDATETHNQDHMAERTPETKVKDVPPRAENDAKDLTHEPNKDKDKNNPSEADLGEDSKRLISIPGAF